LFYLLGMRLIAVFLICMLPFASVVSTQAESACLCANEAAPAQMDTVACCELPADCCWQGDARPGQAIDWLLTLNKVDTSPARIVVTKLTLPELLRDRGSLRALATLHPPPPSARFLRTVQQSWLI
jgi:hypothetical protein